MSTDSLLLAAKIELDEIDRKLEQFEPLRQRRAELAEFLRVGSTVRPVIQTAAAHPDVHSGRVTFKDTVVAASKRMLTGGRWMPTRQIIEQLEKQGIAVSGETDNEKVAKVSGILNKSGEFIGQRGKGWSLRQQQLVSPKVEAKDARTSLAPVVRAALPH